MYTGLGLGRTVELSGHNLSAGKMITEYREKTHDYY